MQEEISEIDFSETVMMV